MKEQQKGKGWDEQEIKALEEGGSKAVRKKVLQLAGPSLTEMVLTNLVQMLNMIMVGRVSAEAVAAVGLTNQPVFFALAAFMALNVGTTAIIARAVGAGDYNEANQAAQQAFILNILLSIVIIFVSFIYAEQLLIFMGAAPEVLVDGVLYAQIMFLSLGFITISMGLSAVLRGAGDTVTPMRINVISNILVVVIGFPLIYGYFGLPAMGVVGAAIATAIARLTATIWVTYVLFSGKFIITLSLKKLWNFDKSMIQRIVKVGLPAAGEQFLLRGGQIIFARIVAGLGTVTFAANQICFSILGLTFMPGMAFAMAATTLVGQGLGAKRPELAEKFGWETRRIGSIVAGSIGVLFIIFAPYIMMLYTNDPEVVRQGAIALRIVGAVQVAQSTQFILAGALRGAGDTKYPLYAMFVGVWGFRVILCILFVMVLEWGILGAWLAIAVDQIVRSIIIHTRYKNGKWKNQEV
ncbi:MATE family efflux transporter [Bacillus horti]|uniref:Probable multidrug resistance protein NorM n=1 Tax=Caldalkalibacillus horti TaxID=77523 RepID=A0ABT9W499_9BACI|nr:MATE family efflux transporter [Bacillus horti]MDQ0168070.1 putative MATE family efflux protein [Bacillus horti]